MIKAGTSSEKETKKEKTKRKKKKEKKTRKRNDNKCTNRTLPVPEPTRQVSLLPALYFLPSGRLILYRCISLRMLRPGTYVFVPLKTFGE
jgi:hypothetical protein